MAQTRAARGALALAIDLPPSKRSRLVAETALQPEVTRPGEASSLDSPLVIPLLSATAPSAPALPQAFIDTHLPAFINGVNHVLAKDPNLYQTVVEKPFTAYLKPTVLESQEPDAQLQLFFESLCLGVISQQVSGAAARSIKRKFALFFLNGKRHIPKEEQPEEWLSQSVVFPSPKEVLACSVEDLRSCGLSGMKALYLTSVAQNFESRSLTLEVFQSTNLDMVSKRLVDIKGIGDWSAKMFLIFGLKRMNVHTLDDLGVARGLSVYFNSLNPELYRQIKAAVVLDPKAKRRKSKIAAAKNRTWLVVPEEYGEYFFSLFDPYQSVVMAILWRLSDTLVEANG